MKSSRQLSFFSWKVILFGLCYFINSIDSHVLIYQTQTNQLLEEFDDWPALFGPNIPPNGLKLIPIIGNPLNGCGKMINARDNKNVAVIERGPENCSFETKVRNAQKSNFKAVIVYNTEGNELEQMSAKNSTAIEIPSVFVGKTAGFRLQEYIKGPSHGIYVVINDELPFNINTQLILPFSILIGLCFLIMIFYMVYRCVREERRLRQYRLPKSMLKKIPIIKFTKTNDLSYDTCVICLEEFVEGDKLRVLPCKHPYHSHCIDPWLTKNRRVCPVCKRKVFGKDEERRNPNRQSSMDSADTDDDSTPLLRPADNSSTNHGTFSRNTETQTNNSNDNAADEENQMSDDENVLLTHYLHQRGTTRINPFDRAPNVPTRSIWSYPIFRFFRPNSSSISINSSETMLNPDVVASLHAAGIVNDDEAAQLLWSPSILPATAPIPSANNILNPNLSGSFKDDDDDEMEVPHQSIYEPIAVATPFDENPRTRRNQNQSSNDRNNLTTDPDSVFIQTPSHGGIGVAALPNANSVSDSGALPSENQQRDVQSTFWSHFYV